MEFHHEPVLLNEVLDALAITEGKTFLDGTVGGAGHSFEIAKRLDASGTLICLDQDPEALEEARRKLEKVEPGVLLVKSNFRDMDRAIKGLNITGVDGILLDLGVSSYQLDESSRGFTYRDDAVLDMRMDPSLEVDAKYLVNSLKESELVRIIREYGEENWAVRIAKFIVEERKEKPIVTTLDLVEIIKKAVPKGAREPGKHPARRTFQALRIEVNREIDSLNEGLDKATAILNPNGRLVVISYHSLEDRAVKEFMKTKAKGCTCDKRIPVCVCDGKKELKIITKSPICPSETEVETNSRARSAKLRVAEKI